MKKGTPTITIPVQKVHTWASQGKGSEQIAKNLGITVEDLFNSLASLAEKNRKSAQHIRQLLAANDRRPKPQNSKKAQSSKNAPASSGANMVQSQSTPKRTSATPAQTETAPKAAPIEKKMSVEAEALQLEIRKAEKDLEAIDRMQAEAEIVVEEGKKAALQHEQVFKELAQRLKEEKAKYEAEMSKLEEAEQALITCEGRRTEKVKHLAELKAKLRSVSKPEIYVCDGEIQTENVETPKDIDVSGWAQIIDTLPDNIGSNLRKRDAELLIRLRAIMSSIDRDDAELAFDNEILQAAYEALAVSTG